MIKKSVAFAIPAFMLMLAGLGIGGLTINQKPYLSICFLFLCSLTFILVERYEHEEKFHSFAPAPPVELKLKKGRYK